MASQLPTIINAIKAYNPQYNGQNVTIRSGATIPNTANATDLPMRIISAIGNSGGQVQRLTLGSSPLLTLRWQITDVLLGQQVGLGTGEKEQSDAQITYASAYADLIRTLVTNKYQIEDVRITMETIEFPVESGNRYYGVSCEYIIKEIIQ
jgi:hypothetical protein